jgi:protein SCO1
VAGQVVFNKAREFISGWRFPVIVITVIISTVLSMAAVLLIPPTAGAAYAFAQDFKTLCFGYDRTTGSMEWAYVWMFLVQPLILASLVFFIWRGPLRHGWAVHRASFFATAAGAFAVVAAVALTAPGFLMAGPVADPTVFPGNRIRTAVPAAPFRLVNQESDSVALEDFAGEVVVLTAIYATCGDTCPLILEQIKSAVGELTEEEKQDLHVIAITLDPETDTPAMLSMMAEARGVEAPLFNTVTGDPAYVNQVLDRYDFRRWRNDAGAIEHTNLIHVIDRKGNIAFRFTLGALQETWLRESLKLVLSESPAT